MCNLNNLNIFHSLILVMFCNYNNFGLDLVINIGLIQNKSDIFSQSSQLIHPSTLDIKLLIY